MNPGMHIAPCSQNRDLCGVHGITNPSTCLDVKGTDALIEL